MAHIPTEVRRRQLVDAAITVIARDGVDGARTRSIAQEAGASLATLHYCFDTKENLLWAVFEHLADSVRASLEASAPAGGTPAEVASHLLAETLRQAQGEADADRAQLEIWLWAERNDPDQAARQVEVYLEAYTAFLRKATPPLRPDQLETVARLVLALVDGLNLQLITHGDPALLERELATATAAVTAYLDTIT